MKPKTKPMLVLMTTAMLFLLGASAHAQTIRVDGDLSDAGWKQARSLETFQTFDGKTPQAATTGLLLADASTLYLAFHCTEPLMDKLETTPLPRDGAVYNNDCIEVFIAPFEKQDLFFHLIVDASGQIYDALNTDGREESRYEFSINAKTEKQQNGWTLEMAVPLCELGLSNARDALMNFGRERKPVLEDTAWHGLFAQPQSWKRVPLALDSRYDGDVHAWSFGETQYGTNEATAQLMVSDGSPIEVLVQAQQSGQWTTIGQQTLTSTPDHLMRVALPYALLPRGKPQAVRLVLQRNQQPVFRATYRLDLPTEALIAALPVPYFYAEEEWGFVQLQSSLSASSLKFSRIRLIVKAPNGKTVSMQEIFPLHKTTRAAFPISSWRSGTGSLTAQLFSGDLLIASRTVATRKRPGPFTKTLRPATP